MTTEVVTQVEVDPGAEKARKNWKKRLRRERKKKGQEKKAAERRGGRKGGQTAGRKKIRWKVRSRYHVTGTDVKSITQNIVAVCVRAHRQPTGGSLHQGIKIFCTANSFRDA